MNTTVQFSSIDQEALPAGPLFLAIGIFDGVHLGHQSVIRGAIEAARSNGGLAGVLTFWPHPTTLFRPDKPAQLILERQNKLQILSELGLNFLIEQDFSAEFSRTSAAGFVELLLRGLPGLKGIFVGENWRFGRGREGDVNVLKVEAAKFGVTVVAAPRLDFAGAPVSSSRIRDRLEKGTISEVNALLGYSYRTDGVVQAGRQLARTLGFPTLNIFWAPELKPRFGVYAVTVDSGQFKGARGVANYGVRPTVTTTEQPLLEVHMLDGTTLSYGDSVTVRWLQFIRLEVKFTSLDELRRQVENDRLEALKFFEESGTPRKSNNA